MGYIRHHAILCTSWNEKRMVQAHHVAKLTFDKIAPVTPLMRGFVNGEQSFVVLPDGSNEGWEHSDDGDKARKDFLAYLQREHMVWDEDRPSWYVKWAEIMYGDENDFDRMERSSADPVLQYDEDAVL